MRTNSWMQTSAAGPASPSKGRWSPRTRKHLSAALASLGLSTALAIGVGALPAASAYADTPTATKSTTVTVTADPNALLEFTVPQVIKFNAGADGTLTGPTASTIPLVNHSVFGIHVTKVQVTPKNGWTIVGNTSKDGAENQISFQFGPTRNIDAASAVNGLDTSANASLNLGYAGSDTSTIELQTAGKICNVTKDMTTKQEVATITWTVAPGFAS